MNILRSCLLFACAVHGSVAVFAAPIPGLYNTGVDDDGNILVGGGVVDPHYELVESSDEAYPGPEVVTLNEGWPVQAGVWLLDGPDSRWIAPRREQNVGNNEGDYYYRTTFDLTGFDPSMARITGRWSSDNGGVDILINGVSTGLRNDLQFGSWTEFEIAAGFVEGENSLEFVVNNAPPGINPTGLRVELRGTVELPDEVPSIVQHPVGGRDLVGGSVTLQVVADGTPPLHYQWMRGDVPVGTDSPQLDLTGLTLEDGGAYTVIVSNESGETVGGPAEVLVLQPIPGLYGTGVNDSGAPLDDLLVDSHYTLVENADGESPDAIVHDTSVFPIVEGPWVASSDTSKWVSPRGDTAAAAGGDYVYRITFDLSGFDPDTAFLTGQWSTDNEGLDILLNGVSTGFRNTAGFASFTPFAIEPGTFVSGLNTLDFKLNNAGAGYTGLRVDGLRGGAQPGAGVPLRIVRQPADQTALLDSDVLFSVLADGPGELSYQWYYNDEPVGPGGPELLIEAVSPANEGTYRVTVSAGDQELDSDPATLVVLDPIPGLFNTGIGDDGLPLDDLEVDPHYTLAQKPDVETDEPIVLDSTLFPIVAGPWVANSEEAKWIGVRPDNNGTFGDYIYRLEVDLSEFDPSSVFLRGRWATDNLGPALSVNGVETGLRNDGQFVTFTNFVIESGFVEGINTLDFVVNNAGDADNPTGLIVAGLEGGGRTQDPNLVLPRGPVFGERPDPLPVQAVLEFRNSGRMETLTISEAVITGPQASHYTLGTVPASLAPQEIVQVTVDFDPGDRRGAFEAVLQVTSNDPGTPVMELDLGAVIPTGLGIVAHYRMDEADGAVMLDDSGFGRHGAYQTAGGGAVVLGQEGIAGDRAVSFDSGGDGAGFAEIGEDVLPVFESFTVSLWVNRSDSQLVTTLFSRGTGTGDPFALVANGADLLWFSGGEQGLELPGALPAGVDVHVVLVFDANVTRLYLDGVLAATMDATAFNDTPRNVFQIGATNSALGFNGIIDDVQIYGRAISGDEAAFLYENPAEVIGGGEPPVPPSEIRILSIAVEGNNAVLRFTSEPGKVYSVGATETLEGFDLLPEDVPAAAAPATETTFSTPTNGLPQQFFRVGEKQ
ncbi:MAG TPA: LamG-like jellyroll fold domain-containing protein [Verrucomicrobiales bacterium]|nr:LamG-like jellyroll fold domain-containing protein [Verrucomicrobiales bacterium]